MKILFHSTLMLLLTAGCGKLQETETGSKTNWLSSCQLDSDCSSLSNAICADVCTRACDTDANCDDLGSNLACRHSDAANKAVCLPAVAEPQPSASTTTAAPVSPSQSLSQTPIPANNSCLARTGTMPISRATQPDPRCDVLAAEARCLRDEVLTRVNNTCRLDSDCEELGVSVSCFDGCHRSQAFATSQQAVLSDVLEGEVADLCQTFASMSCVNQPAGGCLKATAKPGCVAGQCQLVVPPAATPCSVDATDPAFPGVNVHLEADTCEFPSGSGGQFRYSVTGMALAPFALPASQGCGLCYDATKLSTWTEFKIEGAGIHYCETCDVGCCAPNTAMQVNIDDANVAPKAINWPGQQWNGSSDTGNLPFGVFPPGNYDAKVSVSLPGVGSIVARLPIVVTD